MENENQIDIKAKAQTAIYWASGSWGQGQFDSPRYDNLTMADLWYEVAKIATKNSHAHLDRASKVVEGKKIS
jgi:hypothetical protein